MYPTHSSQSQLLKTNKLPGLTMTVVSAVVTDILLVDARLHGMEGHGIQTQCLTGMLTSIPEDDKTIVNVYV